MVNKERDGIVFMTLIADRKNKDSILTALLEHGAHLVTSAYGRGTVKSGYLQNILGLVPEIHKVVIFCVLKKEAAETILKMLADRFHFDLPNTGIAFTVPIKRLSY